jgi:hypothetical protein
VERASRDQYVIRYIEATLINGWTNYQDVPPTSHTKAAFTKDPMGFVHLRGLVRRLAGTSTLPIFRLPRGYRPKELEIFPATAASAAPAFITIRVDVTKDGNVYIPVGDGSLYTSLSGITFRAER